MCLIAGRSLAVRCYFFRVGVFADADCVYIEIAFSCFNVIVTVPPPLFDAIGVVSTNYSNSIVGFISR